MALDLGTWPLISLTYKGTPIASLSLTQVWFQSDINFSKGAQITRTNIFHLTWPQTTLDLWYVTFYLINIWRNPYCIFDPSLVVIGLQLFKFSKKIIQMLHIPLTWPQMTVELVTWPLTSLTYKGTHIASLTKVWFQWDLNFSKETKITKTNIFLVTWAQMTFDLSTWPLTSLTYEGTLIAFSAQVWL